MSVQAVEIAFVMYPVSDMDRARQFYEGVLGLKPETAIEFSPGKWWVEYDLGTAGLGITNFAPPACTNGPSVALEVADYDHARETVKRANVAITWDNDTPVCRSFGVKDPDGNVIFLHKRKAQPAVR